jgi:beta-1,4-mannosyltransferase
VFSILAAVDALVNSVRLGAALLAIPRPDLLLVQNPPAIPTLPVAWMIARLRRARFVIDWHNLGYSILALRLGRRHVVVRLARWVVIALEE